MIHVPPPGVLMIPRPKSPLPLTTQNCFNSEGFNSGVLLMHFDCVKRKRRLDPRKKNLLGGEMRRFAPSPPVMYWEGGLLKIIQKIGGKHGRRIGPQI